jgi:hypothetical protein
MYNILIQKMALYGYGLGMALLINIADLFSPLKSLCKVQNFFTFALSL